MFCLFLLAHFFLLLKFILSFSSWSSHLSIYLFIHFSSPIFREKNKCWSAHWLQPIAHLLFRERERGKNNKCKDEKNRLSQSLVSMNDARDGRDVVVECCCFESQREFTATTTTITQQVEIKTGKWGRTHRPASQHTRTREIDFNVTLVNGFNNRTAT